MFILRLLKWDIFINGVSEYSISLVLVEDKSKLISLTIIRRHYSNFLFPLLFSRTTAI